jgi:F-type H+-transporting ATPase subunit c
MDAEGLKYIAIGLTTIGMLGAAIGVGNIFSGVVNSIARNPALESKIMKNAFIGAALSEAMGLFACLLAFLMLYS